MKYVYINLMKKLLISEYKCLGLSKIETVQQKKKKNCLTLKPTKLFSLNKND